MDEIKPVPPVNSVSDPVRKAKSADERGLKPRTTHLPEDKTDGYALIDSEGNPLSQKQAQQLLATSLMSNEQYQSELSGLKTALTNVAQQNILNDNDITELLLANSTVAGLVRSTYTIDGPPATDSESLSQIQSFDTLASSFGITRKVWRG